jgi:hypothetical protein
LDHKKKTNYGHTASHRRKANGTENHAREPIPSNKRFERLVFFQFEMVSNEAIFYTADL